MPKLILFDVDGTMVDSGGAGKEALTHTLEDLVGITDGFHSVSFVGKTDMQILREALSKHGLEFEPRLMAGFLDRYPDHLKAAMVTRTSRLKPRVRELLLRLQAKNGFFLGLLTGNVEVGARMKLEPFSLNSFFPFGAFGDDEEDRNLLLPVAVRRLVERKGVSVDYANCVVIGDTPLDVACAKAFGAPCIAVGTGPCPIEDLYSTDADLVLQDFTDTDLIVRWLDRL